MWRHHVWESVFMLGAWNLIMSKQAQQPSYLCETLDLNECDHSSAHCYIELLRHYEYPGRIEMTAVEEFLKYGHSC